jgi:hypothetical protein
MATDWITVPRGLVDEAAREVLEATVMLNSDNDTVDVPRGLFNHVADFLSEGIDSGPGIDCSVLVALVTALRLAEEGKQVCRECGGDGFVYDQEQYDRKYAALSDADRNWDWGDSLGMQDCPSCSREGTVALAVA